MKKKRIFLRKSLAWALSLCMVVGLFPALAFAGTEKSGNDTIKFVTLGDSMTNGYGLEGYEPEQGDVSGYLQVAEDAYPAKFADYLKEKTGKEVELTQLAVSGTRAEDLNFILNFDWNNSHQCELAQPKREWNQEDWFSTFEFGDKYTYDHFVDGLWQRYKRVTPGEEGVIPLSQKYQKSVSEADIISVSLGNANFGAFMFKHMMGALDLPGYYSDSDWMDVTSALRNFDPEVQNIAAQIQKSVENIIAESGMEAELSEKSCKLAKILTYTMTSYFVNYAQCMDRIVELNPDAQIMIIGLFNAFDGMKLSLADGTEIDIGDVMDVCQNTLNMYLAGMPAAYKMAGKYPDATFYFVEPGRTEVFIKQFAEGNLAKYPAVRSKTINELKAYVNMDGVDVDLLKKLEDAIDEVKNQVQISGEGNTKVEIFMTALYGKCSGNPDKMNELAQKAAVYLGLEKLMSKAAKANSLDINDLVKLPSALGNPGEIFGFLTVEENNPVKAEIERLLSNNNDLINQYSLYYMPEAIDNVITEDGENSELLTMMHLFARCIAGDGIGIHPDEVGHDSILECMIDAYEKVYTPGQAVVDKTTEAIKYFFNFMNQYGRKTGIEVWNYAVESGMVDQLNAQILQLHNKIKEDLINSIPAKAEKPAAVFTATGADTGMLSGVTGNMKYSFNGYTWKDIQTEDGNLTLNNLKAGALYIINKGSGNVKDSAIQTIFIGSGVKPFFTSVPTSDKYEYSTDGASYTTCDGSVSNLPAGTYYVRAKANGTTLASAAQKIVVKAGSRGVQYNNRYSLLNLLGWRGFFAWY